MLKLITFLLTVIEYQTKLIKMLVVLTTNKPTKPDIRRFIGCITTIQQLLVALFGLCLLCVLVCVFLF